MDSTTNLPVAVIGAGPVGLAAAAHLLERGLEPLIFEAGPTAGAAIEQWRHIRLFSPWRFNLDAAAVRLLEASGWESPRPTALPYGGELIDSYLTPLAALPADQLPAADRRPRRGRDPQGLDKTHLRNRDTTPFVVRVEHAGRRNPRPSPPPRSSTPPAPGPPATRWAPPACPPSAKTPLRTGSPPRCRTSRPRPGSLRRTAASWWSAPATPPPTP